MADSIECDLGTLSLGIAPGGKADSCARTAWTASEIRVEAALDGSVSLELGLKADV